MKSFVSVNPYTAAALAEYPLMDAAEVSRRLQLAASAWQNWRKTSFPERAARLRRAAELLLNRRDSLAALITAEMGKTLREARAEIEKCATACEWYAAQGESLLRTEAGGTPFYAELRHEPTGAVLAIMPWNFPFWQVFRYAAPVLMGGNVTLLKHAPNVCGCANAIEALMADAGFPEGVFQQLRIAVGDVPAVLDNDVVQGVTLTGSTRAGAAVAALAGARVKRSLLELGGSDPLLLLDDADMARAAEVAVQSRMSNAGQSCIAAKRWIVSRRRAEEFIENVRTRIAALRQGDPLNPETDLGPMARPDLADALERQLKASIMAGAQLLTGAQRDGCNFAPALILAQANMPAADEELFGPVAAVFVVEDEAEMIALANRTRYGLGASIWSRDRERALRLAGELQAGNVFINSLVRSDVRLPFGGVKQSGYGRELGREGITAFMNLKTVVAE